MLLGSENLDGLTLLTNWIFKIYLPSLHLSFLSYRKQRKNVLKMLSKIKYINENKSESALLTR